MSYEVYAQLSEEMRHLQELFERESERSVVLSVGCFLEDRLRELLERMESLPKVIQIDDPGYPRTFQRLINEARMRDLFSQDIADDMHVIRELRGKVFAHSFKARELQRGSARNPWCEKLKTPDAPNAPTAPPGGSESYQRFMVAAMATIQAVVGVIFEDEDRLRRLRYEREDREQAEGARRAGT